MGFSIGFGSIYPKDSALSAGNRYSTFEQLGPVVFLVPDRPPSDISASSLGASIVQLKWSLVPTEYTNGKVLGYKMMISGGNGTSGKNKTIATIRTLNNIEGLTPSTNYSFQVLAFTAKGDGARSGLYFAKTWPGS